MATPPHNTAAPVKAAITPHALGGRILEIRGQRVLLDSDLAELYEVDTKRLNEQVRRNADRFPADFMFQLSPVEFADLKSQFATSSWGGKRKLPNAFTEHGAIMAASVLNSKRAVEMNVPWQSVWSGSDGRTSWCFMTYPVATPMWTTY